MTLRKIFFCICILLSFISSAQDTDLNKDWIGIDTLITRNDLTRTALQRTNALYQKAKQQNLPAQIIKALIYRYSLEEKITSNEPNHTFNLLKEEIAAAKDPTEKAILYALLAKQYWQYYNNHRWNLYSRKNTKGIAKEDIATWTDDDLTTAITRNFLLSLNDLTLLQQQGTDAYAVLIIKGNYSRSFTLLDLLSKEALDYFKSGAGISTKPSNSFSITTARSLGMLEEFTRSPFVTPDSTATQWLALELYRKLLAFHLKDDDKTMLVQLNTERIAWVYQNAVFPDKETLYKTSLGEIITKYNNTPSSAQAHYLLAKLEGDKAANYQPFGDTSGRYRYNQAEQIIQQALPQYSGLSAGAVAMQSLLATIRRKEVRTQTERVNLPNKPFRSLVSFRNIDTVFGRVIRISGDNEGLRDEVYSWDPGYWVKVANLKSYHSFNQALPAVNDHQMHSAEIKIDGLPVGEYVLLTCSNNSFNPSADKMSLQFFYVSNISFVKNKSDFFIVNRDN